MVSHVWVEVEYTFPGTGVVGWWTGIQFGRPWSQKHRGKEAAIKGCSVHEVNWICCAYAPKRGWLEKDCAVVWAFTGELRHLFLIWVALILGQKGVKQCRGQEESVGSLFQLCEYWSHVISCITSNPSIFFIACPLALLTSKCAGAQLTPQAFSNQWAALLHVTCQFSRKQHHWSS